MPDHYVHPIATRGTFNKAGSRWHLFGSGEATRVETQQSSGEDAQAFANPDWKTTTHSAHLVEAHCTLLIALNAFYDVGFRLTKRRTDPA